MKALKAYLIILLVTVLIFLGGIAHAIPMAEFKYAESNAGGMWQYDYTLFNTSHPILDAGADLYDVSLYFNPTASFNIASLPTGWDWTSGAGFIDVFSLNPGAPPAGTDIAPGSSLSSFIFQFDYQAGKLPFDATIVNPADINNPVVFSGTTTPASSAPVPEPSTILLLGIGLAGLAGWKRFGKR